MDNQGGGGGGVELDQISDIRPPKKIKYQISHPLKNQISDLPGRYQGTPVSPPPPNQLSDYPAAQIFFE